MNNHNLFNRILKASRTVKLLLGLFLWLFSTICYGQSTGVEIDYVSIEDNNLVQITYTIGQGMDSDLIEVYYYEELSVFSPTGTSIDEFDINTGTKTIVFDNPDPDKKLYYQLFIENQKSHIHSPIYLQELIKDEDPCAIQFTVSWTNYEIIHRNHLDILPPIPLALPFDSVHVNFYYFYTSGCGETSVESWSASQIDHLSTSELEFTITESGAYCIQVHSSSSDREIKSESNIRITDFWDPAELPDIDILHVSVEGDRQLSITFNSTEDDMGTPDFQYELYRGENISAQFERVNRVESPLFTPYDFSDNVPDDSTNPWYYYVLVGKEACDISNYASTDTISSIFLEASYSDNISANQINLILDWQHHHPNDFPYILWQQMAGATPEQIPGTLITPPHQLAIEIDENDFGGEVKIWLEAENFEQNIKSNVVIIKIDILEQLPNAFRPESEIPANRVFTPSFLVVPANYRFSIFDRNGLRLFFTEDENAGWDGKVQTTGQPAPEGAYIYEISFDQADKPTRGVVYLVR